MRAMRLNPGQASPSVEDCDPPTLGSDDLLVRVEATMVTSYLSSLIDGSGGFETPPRPFTPGSEATGTVEAVGENVHNVSVGTRVYCDSYVSTMANGERFDSAFVGCFAVSGAGQRIFSRYADGTLATHVRLPAECVTSIEPALEKTSMETLCRLGWFGTAHSAFTCSGFQAGGAVAVTGANGVLGSGAVLLALAMGASQVFALGRSTSKLAPLAAVDPRVVVSTDPPPASSVDLVMSCAAAGGPELVESCIPSLRPRGSVVILASLDPAPRAAGLVTKNLAVHGSFWFPRSTPSLLVRLIESGQLPVDRIESKVYALAEIEAALAAAAGRLSAFQQVVVKPDLADGHGGN